MGTDEREGLDSTNIVCVAPAGNGHEVSGHTGVPVSCHRIPPGVGEPGVPVHRT